MFALASATVSVTTVSVTDSEDYDPIARARASVGKIVNQEATVPAQCYTRTAGSSNPCWTCHTLSQKPNHMDDWDLQQEYAFSDFALVNRWTNVFRDRREELAKTSDDEILAWIRQDNYAPLKRALADREDYPGYKPDLDFARGFDEEGFAKDGSAWRAIRYKPFPGTFWPTNGSTDDVMIRLPKKFRVDVEGEESRAIYKINLSILEAAVASPQTKNAAAVDRVIEEIDEKIAGFDVDGDGSIEGKASVMHSLPSHYVGGAKEVAVSRNLFPYYTEFLHSVRYVDPDRPTLLATRMKELRYSRKILHLDHWGRLKAYEDEVDAKEQGKLPIFAGSPLVGLTNDFGWQLQGFIEDEKGRLRLQTEEEHLTCMGCHGSIGVTVDNTFTLSRKIPGAAGWRHQDIRGIHDAPQAGHDEPEILRWFKRVGGGDEFRANEEILERFFADGKVKEAEVRRASKGGDRDIAWLLKPTRERALQLNKAYRAIVLEQSYELGRDAVIGGLDNIHKKIENGSTELSKTGKVFMDGRLWLDW